LGGAVDRVVHASSGTAIDAELLEGGPWNETVLEEPLGDLRDECGAPARDQAAKRRRLGGGTDERVRTALAAGELVLLAIVRVQAGAVEAVTVQVPVDRRPRWRASTERAPHVTVDRVGAHTAPVERPDRRGDRGHLDRQVADGATC